jgi:hypothetical protein
MECVSCEALLDELRRGELPARVEAEARSHLALCPSCRAAHMRLLRVEAERTLPATPAPPSAKLRAGLSILRWLRPRPKPQSGERAPRTLPLPGAALGVLGRLATAPQVAMGSVMLLIVLVGLWSVPQLTRQRASRFRASVMSERVHRPRSDSEPGTPPPAAGAHTPAESAPERTPDSHVRGSRRLQPSAAAKNGSTDLDAAMQHFRAHEYALATPLFSRALVGATSSSDQTTALLYLARAERALGHCDRAVNSYDTLVHIHPGKFEARTALREAVACYARIHDFGKAQRLLDHAAVTPELESSARSVAAAYPAFARKSAPAEPAHRH